MCRGYLKNLLLINPYRWIERYCSLSPNIFRQMSRSSPNKYQQYSKENYSKHCPHADILQAHYKFVPTMKVVVKVLCTVCGTLHAICDPLTKGVLLVDALKRDNLWRGMWLWMRVNEELLLALQVWSGGLGIWKPHAGSEIKSLNKSSVLSTPWDNALTWQVSK